jgi:hypothetical protein
MALRVGSAIAWKTSLLIKRFIYETIWLQIYAQLIGFTKIIFENPLLKVEEGL